MPNANDLSATVRNAVQRGQETVAANVKTLSETATNLIPEIPRAAQYVPQAKAAVNAAFDIAEQAVSRQRELVIGVLDSLEHRLGTEAAEKPKAKAATAETTS